MPTLVFNCSCRCLARLGRAIWLAICLAVPRVARSTDLRRRRQRRRWRRRLLQQQHQSAIFADIFIAYYFHFAACATPRELCMQRQATPNPCHPAAALCQCCKVHINSSKQISQHHYDHHHREHRYEAHHEIYYLWSILRFCFCEFLLWFFLIAFN